MHGSFISFTKPELKICVLLKTSSEVTSLLEVIVSYVLLRTSSKVTSLSGVAVSCILLRTFSEVTFLSGVTVSLAEVTCFAGSTCVKGAGIEGASIEGAGIGAACTNGACIGDASTCTGGAYIGAWDADIRDEFIGDIYVRYAGGVGTVKRLGIHLQSSQILEFRQYSPALETKVGAS